MAKKQQELRIKVVDHRGEGEPDVEWESFTNHTDYLRRIRKIMDPPPGTVASEQTLSIVHYKPESKQTSAFDE